MSGNAFNTFSLKPHKLGDGYARKRVERIRRWAARSQVSLAMPYNGCTAMFSSSPVLQAVYIAVVTLYFELKVPVSLSYAYFDRASCLCSLHGRNRMISKFAVLKELALKLSLGVIKRDRKSHPFPENVD